MNIKNLQISVNGKPAELSFRPHAYKDGDNVIVKLNESENVIEIIKNEDISLYKDVISGEITGLVIKNIIDLEKFKQNE